LTKLLARKFGALDERIEARVRAASVSELELWIERILDASTVDEVLR
jgi:hypothetical protein